MSGRYEHYDWIGGREWMFVHGPAHGPQVLIVPPLFEELNFTRATVVAMARGLGERGIGAWILDLPGTGESAQALEATGWGDWRAAVASATRRIGARPHVAAMRGGALIDDAVTACSSWRFASSDGAALLRQMERAQTIGDREAGRTAAGPGAEHVDLVGYRLSVALRDTLRAATPATPPGPCRAVPFAGPGVAPWRRAEPTSDPALAAMLADDLARWIATCGG